MNKIALVFGATGLVGRNLVNELIRNKGYARIKVFSRRPINIEHIKVIEHVVDIENVETYIDLIKGDDLYICLGTTIRKAGSVARVEEIDRDLPASIARLAASKGIERVAVVSAVGANSSSRIFYNRIKGEMEQRVAGAGLSRTVIVRPSMILGKREEFRFAEYAGKVASGILQPLMIGRLKKYRPVHAGIIARAMIAALNSDSERLIYSSEELPGIADEAYSAGSFNSIREESN